ncbi:hypothetical protein RSSM_01464 [Rhodopirellula sallentina SM41]|uniref:Uncharacterized protein n=2 Tax=Rhodopirellula TaxID=265488 RepID=M5U6Y8_9BACT|nr:hypothetical protein RSSM_01464 [Rhodopirellula sallentina SM41]
MKPRVTWIAKTNRRASMPGQAKATPIRLSQNQIRSNPVLASIREYNRGRGRRDQEQRQLAKLLQLQDEGVVLHRIPTMIRVDSSMLKTTRSNIGVVGLVVDNQGQGYVTKLKVVPNPTWDISVDLPFRPVHIQNLLLRVLSGSDLDDSLPELFAYKITDSLAERCEGDSMDIACLLAIFNASTNHEDILLRAVAAVVSPVNDEEHYGLLEASKSVSSKLDAFLREFGSGSLLVRHADDEAAATFDAHFDQVWPVRTLSDLADCLAEADLLRSFLGKTTLRSGHGNAIASQLECWLSDESQYDRAEVFLNRVRRRIDNETPIKICLEVLSAEEDLHRHRGNFDAAIALREERVKLTEQPFVSSYEREADSDNRHAAALYDAHRFPTAIECLKHWHKRIEQDPKICLPETRAKLLNTLARCLVIVEDVTWESLFELSIQIQSVCDPCNLPVTQNFLVHGYLKAQKFERARTVLEKNIDKANAFQIWLSAECSRQAGKKWTEQQCEAAIAIAPTFHVRGFACQAIARQEGRDAHSRLKYFGHASRAFSYGMERDKTNIKRVLHIFCSLAIAILSHDRSALRSELDEYHNLTASNAFRGIRDWYEREIAQLENDQDWASIERLFRKVPHL